jgi:hypothetical protein
MREFYAPFYLAMMGTNAIKLPTQPQLFGEFLATGKRTSPDQVTALLRGPWRAALMGAWFSMFHAATEVGAEVTAATLACAGAYTAPPLTIALVHLLGADAIPTLSQYLTKDIQSTLGASGFVAAAIEHLGGKSSVLVTDQDQCQLAAMMKIATQITACRFGRTT